MFSQKPEVFLSDSRHGRHIDNLSHERFGIWSHVFFLLQATSLACSKSIWDGWKASSCLDVRWTFSDTLMVLDTSNLVLHIDWTYLIYLILPPAGAPYLHGRENGEETPFAVCFTKNQPLALLLSLFSPCSVRGDTDWEPVDPAFSPTWSTSQPWNPSLKTQK